MQEDHIEQARWLAVLALTGIGLYLCWLMLQPFVAVVEWAIVLVIVFHPIHKRLASKTRRRGLSAFLSCALVVLLVVLPLCLLGIAVTKELTQVVPNLRTDSARLLNAQTLLGNIPSWLSAHLGIDIARSQDFLIEQLRRSGEFLLGLSWNLLGNIAGTFVKGFFVLFTMYYLFRDTDNIIERLPDVLPMSAEQSEALISRTREVVNASVYGVVAIASLQGILGGLAFWIVGVPSPILWAVLMAFVCMIPVAGSFFVWLPLALYLMVEGHWIKGIGLIVWGALVVSTVDNFLRPRLIRNQTKLHELFIFFSVLGGIGLFGLIGIVLGPVVLALTLGLLQSFKVQTSSHHA